MRKGGETPLPLRSEEGPLPHRRECNELLRHAHKELEAAKLHGRTSVDESASATALNMTLLGQVRESV